MDYKISVIIPLYNHEAFISGAIKSVQDQTYPVFEIIIIDDGSKDDSGKIALKLSNSDNRIKYFYQTNSGAHSAINKGVKMAKGDYVSILNSDDIYHCNRFEKIINKIRNTNADVVFSGIDFIGAGGEKKENEWYYQAKDFFLKNNNLPLALINGNFIMTTSNIVIRRDVFDKIGFFNNLRYTHDLDYFLRLYNSGYNIQFIDEELLTYRMHSMNTINENHSKVRVEWALIIALYIAENSKRQNLIFNDLTKNSIDLFNIIDKHNLTKLVLFFLLQYYLDNNNVEKYYEDCLNKPNITSFIKNII